MRQKDDKRNQSEVNKLELIENRIFRPGFRSHGRIFMSKFKNLLFNLFSGSCRRGRSQRKVVEDVNDEQIYNIKQNTKLRIHG